ncbi:MAG: FAD-binding oxidoreductase [Candidatus Omnitrophica bacterium]|nr:FAD-binding oxidoreductase [Candidatus Omnitrophota bacterium]
MLIKTDKDTFLDYLEDSSGLKGGFADEAIFPESEEEIIDFLKEANLKKRPITISAGRTGVTGGAVPFGGILISTENLNHALEIDKNTEIVKVGCSVRIRKLEEAVLKQGLFYPVDPTEKDATLGGNIATNASGAMGFRFGSTRNHIMSLKIILPNGDTLSLKRGEYFCDNKGCFEISTSSKKILNFKIPDYKMPNIKNAAGYYVKSNMDLIDLFIGHEGTLGIIFEAEFRLIKLPKDILGILSFFKKEEDALSFSDNLRELSFKAAHEENIGQPEVISIEYFDSNSINMLKEEYKNIPSDTASVIFFEQAVEYDINTELLEWYEKMLKDFNSDIDKSWCALDVKAKERLREFRHRLPTLVNEQVKRNGFPKVGTDIAVPKEHFKTMYSFYKESLKNADIEYVIFGHIGDCHLHLNLLPKDKVEFLCSKELYLKFVEKAISLGGTVSAEHGIGKLKHTYLERMYSRKSILQMAKLKKALDPDCILNLDNIFPKEYLQGIKNS